MSKFVMLTVRVLWDKQLNPSGITDTWDSGALIVQQIFWAYSCGIRRQNFKLLDET